MTPRSIPRQAAVPSVAWWAGSLLLVLTLGLCTIVGLVTPYLVVAIGIGTFIALLATAQLPASYAPLPARLFLIAFALIAVDFIVSMRSPADPLFAFNFVMLALYGPVAILLGRIANHWDYGRVARLAAVGVALTLAMVSIQLALGSHRPAGIVLGPIVLSNAALGLAVVATTGVFVARTRRSLLLPLSIVAAIAITVLTQSRGPLLGVLPLLVLTGSLLWWVRLRHSWLYVLGSGVLAALLVLAAVLLGHGRLSRLPGVLAGFFSAEGSTDRTANIRLNLYGAGWRAFLDSPWIGHGWARLMSSAYPYLTPKYLRIARTLPQLHNDVLNFAVAGGIVGILAYLLIIATPMIAAFRSPRDAYWVARVYGTSGLAIVYVFGGLTDLMFGHEYHTAMFVVFNAVVLTLCRDPKSAT